jgi:hypothetical protein
MIVSSQINGPELLVPRSIQSPNAKIQELIGRLKGPANSPNSSLSLTISVHIPVTTSSLVAGLDTRIDTAVAHMTIFLVR